jgi:hypothetical protein
MKWHKAILDISVRLVQLNSPLYGRASDLIFLVTIEMPRRELSYS